MKNTEFQRCPVAPVTAVTAMTLALAVLVGCTMTASTAQAEAAVNQPAPRQFELRWFGGNRTVNVGEPIVTPSTAQPGRIGVRFPKFKTDPVVNRTNSKTYESENDILLRRGTASMATSGAMDLETGVAFMLSSTVEIPAAGGPQPMALVHYPILIRPGHGLEAGTVGTDWIVYRFVRPTSGGQSENVAIVGLVRSSGTPPKGVWIRWGQANAKVEIALTEEMTFVEFVNGEPSGPPAQIEINCDPVNGSSACRIGRVLVDAVEAAKLIDMVPESYALPNG